MSHFSTCCGVTVKHYEKARVWISYAWTRVVVTSLNLINSAQKRIMCQSQTVILFLKIILSDVIAFQASIEILVWNVGNSSSRFSLRGGRGDAYQRVARIVTFIWKHTFARIGEDWVFLGLLGVIMALVSFLMDYTISMCNNARLWLVKDLVPNIYLQFVAWVISVLTNNFKCYKSHFPSTGFPSRLPCFVFNGICSRSSSPGNTWKMWDFPRDRILNHL